MSDLDELLWDRRTKNTGEKLWKNLSGSVRKDLGEREVGVELEMEGVNTAELSKRYHAQDPHYWASHSEGSLRDGGIEFVFNRPMPLADMPKLGASLEHILGNQTPTHSIRTSTHIHVNILHETIRSCYSILGAWWLIEDALIRTQGKAREGNLFCLPVSRAEGILETLIGDIQDGEHFDNSGHEGWRYAALNFTAFQKFGSAEFRFLAGTNDWREVTLWVNALHSFVRTAARLSWDQIKALSIAPASGVLRTLLPPAWGTRLIDQFGLDYLNERIRANADTIHRLYSELARCERRFSAVDHGPEDALDHADDPQYMPRMTLRGRRTEPTSWGDSTPARDPIPLDGDAVLYEVPPHLAEGMGSGGVLTRAVARYIVDARRDGRDIPRNSYIAARGSFWQLVDGAGEAFRMVVMLAANLPAHLNNQALAHLRNTNVRRAALRAERATNPPVTVMGDAQIIMVHDEAEQLTEPVHVGTISTPRHQGSVFDQFLRFQDVVRNNEDTEEGA